MTLTILIFGFLTLAINLLTNLLIKKLAKKKDIDNISSTVTFILFFAGTALISFFYNNWNLFLYFITFSTIALWCEYTLGWLYFIIFDARIYRYYDNSLLGFSSPRMLPYWGGAALFFYAMFNILRVELAAFDVVSILLTYTTWATFGLAAWIFIISVSNLLRMKLIRKDHFSWTKFSVFSAFFIGGLLGFLVTYWSLNLFLFIFGVLMISIVLEGLLGRYIKEIHAERFWIYYRTSLFRGNTSLIIIPMWSGALILAITLMTIFLK